MKGFLLISILMLAFATPAFTQGTDTGKFEVFGGYALMTTDGLPPVEQTPAFSSGFFDDHSHASGVNAEATGYFKKGFGITGDFSFNQRHRGFLDLTNNEREDLKTGVFDYLAGPQYKWKNDHSRFEPFARAMFGVAHTRFTASDVVTSGVNTTTTSFQTATTDFAMGLGGGLDIKVGDRFAVRAFQFDYNPVYLKDRSVDVMNSFTGIVTPTHIDGQREDNFRFGFGIVFR